MNKFTPGKWICMNGTDIFEDFISGRQIAACLLDADIPYEQQAANARLIAAAPAMFEALERCRQGFMNLVEFGYLGNARNEIAEIEAALELAGGSDV